MKWLIALLGLIVFTSGCLHGIQLNNETDVIENTLSPSDSLWRTAEFTDIGTGETFSIQTLEKPLLLESFAVWCPTCTSQQREIHKIEGIIHVSLDTDPNEDENKVRDHLNRNGFKSYYAISPKDVTQSLIDEFGINVVNAPRAPVILICSNDSARMLKQGLKLSSTLEEEITKGC